MVAAVLVSRPQKVCAPWRASSMRPVISLKVRLDPVAPFGDDFPQGGGRAGALLLAGRDEDGGAAGGLGGGEGPAAEALVCEQVTRGRPRLEQVVGYLALVHRGRHDGPGADDPAAQVRLMASRKPQGHSAWAASRPNRAARSLPGPVQPSGPRTRDGCLTGSAAVPACWPSSSGSRTASVTRSCSNAPRSQRVRRLASLWCGRQGNR